MASLFGITLSHCQCGEGHRAASLLYHKTHEVTGPTNWNLQHSLAITPAHVIIIACVASCERYTDSSVDLCS